MKPVNGDCLFLVAELCARKMPRAVQDYNKKVRKALTKDQFDTLQKAVFLHRRFCDGHYAADEDEIKALFAAGQLIADLHAEANGHPKKIIELPISAVFSANGPVPPPVGAYADVMRAIGGGILEGLTPDS